MADPEVSGGGQLDTLILSIFYSKRKFRNPTPDLHGVFTAETHKMPSLILQQNALQMLPGVL